VNDSALTGFSSRFKPLIMANVALNIFRRSVVNIKQIGLRETYRQILHFRKHWPALFGRKIRPELCLPLLAPGENHKPRARLQMLSLFFVQSYLPSKPELLAREGESSASMK
jgi:ABC-type iron transport system FetAB ATPase subunit